jgi:hypothetical protein
MLNAVMRHCREEMEKIGEPKPQVLFETTAEVLNGLITTFSRYETELEEKERPKIGRLKVFRPALLPTTHNTCLYG